MATTNPFNLRNNEFRLLNSLDGIVPLDFVQSSLCTIILKNHVFLKRNKYLTSNVSGIATEDGGVVIAL